MSYFLNNLLKVIFRILKHTQINTYMRINTYKYLHKVIQHSMSSWRIC